MKNKIPFNLPYMTGKELYNIADAHFNGRLAGDGPYTKLCHEWLEKNTSCEKALLTHSCTAALEMAALLLNIKPGDEIILPSYTFVSTASAFVLRGATPVFVDIRYDTLNIDEHKIEAAITKRTKAIVPVHYAGVACEMDYLNKLGREHNIHIIEDAAQGVMAKYKGKSLGSIGTMGAYSFHETKNLISGEGGALLINDESFSKRAEIIREKGTDRSQFYRGEIDKYTWQDLGSSFLPGELIAAFLSAQLDEATQITDRRLKLWQEYNLSLELLERRELLRRPFIPKECEHNAHMYYILLPSKEIRDLVLKKFKECNILSVFHYIPLHSSPAGLKYGKTSGVMSNTNKVSERIIRLPLWAGLTEKEQERIVKLLYKTLINTR